jgi:hypothetical protein
MVLSYVILKARREIRVAFLALLFFFFSCSQDSIKSNTLLKERSIVFYIVADNNLESSALSFYSEVEMLLHSDPLDSEYIVLYLDNKDESLLFVNEDGELRRKKSYGKINSLKTETMSSILQEIDQLFPATERGLVFWSHGSGWLSAGNSTRSFGDDSGESMEIRELSESIKNKYDYIVFDTCYMGCIEVAVELEDKCSYLLFSPSSVPLCGIMDSSAISRLAQKASLTTRLISICESFQGRSDKEKQNNPIAMLDMDKMKMLPQLIRLIEIDPLSVDLDSIPMYDFRGNYVFYDMRALFSKLGQNQILSIVDEMTMYPHIINNDEGFISIFIPSEKNVDYWHFYSNTKWNHITSWLNIWIDSSNGPNT